MEQKKCGKKITSFLIKFLIAIGIVVAFYKLPTMVADKISYIQLKREHIKQDLNEEE